MLASIQITAKLRCACPRACTAARTHACMHEHTHTCTYMHTYTSGARMHRWTDSVCTNRHKSYTTSHGNDQVKDNTLILQEELGQASSSHTHANTHARTRVWRICSCTSTQAHTNARTHASGRRWQHLYEAFARQRQQWREENPAFARTHTCTHTRTHPVDWVLGRQQLGTAAAADGQLPGGHAPSGQPAHWPAAANRQWQPLSWQEQVSQ